MSILAKLTLLVPTYERKSYALRQMAYWSGRGSRILVLDGSAQGLSESELTSFGSNIDYRHLPIPYLERLSLGADLVQSEFAALLCDDEFYLPSGLEHCLAELEANSMLVACIGRCLFFQPGRQSNIASHRVYEQMAGYSVEQSQPEDRVAYHLEAYTPSTVYAVQRAPVWKSTLKLWAESASKSSCTYSGEIQFEIVTSFRGQSKVIPVLSWLRSGENQPISDSNWNRKLEFDEWLADERYRSEVGEFYGTTEAHLAALGHDLNLCRRAVRTGVDAYLKFAHQQRVQDRPSLVGRVKGWLPQSLKDRLRGALRPAPLQTSLSQEAFSLAAEGVSVNAEELAAIEAELQRFHARLASGANLA